MVPGRRGEEEGPLGAKRSIFGVEGCASGRAGSGRRSGVPALIEVVFGNGIGVGGIERWGLVEVVR